MATAKQAAASSRGIGIREVTTITFKASDDQAIKDGDLIVAGIKGQDVVGRFGGLDNDGYFILEPVYTSHERKRYRPSSITECYKVSSFEIDKAEEKVEEKAE